MLLHAGEGRRAEIRNFKGGEGLFQLTHFVEAQQLGQAGRLFARAVLEPGASVGFHVHEKDMEVCYFLSGEGTLEDADHSLKPLKPGDANVCLPGQGHGIRNTGTEDLVYLAVVLFPEGQP